LYLKVSAKGKDCLDEIGRPFPVCKDSFALSERTSENPTNNQFLGFYVKNMGIIPVGK
jgi:hypothetical protein